MAATSTTSAVRARSEARLWMAVVLAGVLASVLVAFVLTPLRALITEG